MTDTAPRSLSAQERRDVRGALRGAAARRRAANWVTHRGGERPVAADVRVSVLFRDLAVEQHRAGDIAWSWLDMPDFWDPEDVVAYRVIGASA